MEKREFEENYNYETKIWWTEKKNGVVRTSNGALLSCSPCMEFQGEKNKLTPSDALLVAVNICILTTFFELADKFKINPLSYECEVDGDVTVDDNPRFTKIRIKPKIRVEKKYFEKTKKAILLAKKYCLVTNSLNVPLDLNYTINI